MSRNDRAATELLRDSICAVKGSDQNLDLSPERPIMSDNGIDSLDLLEIGMEIEERSGIVLAEDVLRDIVTLGQLVDLLADRMQTGP